MKTQGHGIASARESEEKYRNLIENISDWVWETDADMVLTYTNPRVRDYRGYEPPQVLGRSMYALIHPAWVDRIRGLIDSMSRECRPVAVAEKRMVAKSGEVVDFEMTVNLIFGRDGGVVGYRGICRDIRDRKRAEEAQRRAYVELEKRVEERTADLESALATLRAILDTAPMGILVVEAKTRRVTYHSIIAEKVFGGPLVGKAYGVDMYPHRVLHDDGSPMMNSEMPLFKSLQSGEHVSDMEILIRQADGKERTVLVNSAPIKDARGRIKAAVAAIIDITRLKSVEKELQEAKSQAEMYLDLMAHDISNLDQVSIGYLELALGLLDSRGKLGPEDRPLLEKALETNQSSSRLIDNVRKIQRSRTGGLKFMPVDVCKVLADLKGHYSHVPGRKVSIRLTAMRQCYVRANELLGDVFINLIGNAIKHSPPDWHLVIDVSLKKVACNGRDTYRVTIEDNGPGIPDAMKGRLFTRLERENTKEGRRGVGLYLVKALLSDMGGSIRVEDRVPGDHRKGTRFVVLLPACDADTKV